jgi:hypothetical protein
MGQASAAANNEPQEELPTEFAFGHDGTIYWAPDPGVELPGRAIFEGWEMSWPEALQAAGHLPLVELTGFAVGSDGKAYGSAERVPIDQREGRATFRGYALTDEEKEIALDELHTIAPNVMIGVLEELKQRRIAAQKAAKKAERDARKAAKKAEREAAGAPAPPRTRRRAR